MQNKLIRFIRRDFRSISTGVKLVVLVMFLRSFGWGFVDPYYAIYLKQFTENYTVIGALAGLFSVVAVFITLPLMRLADRVKEVSLMSAGEVLYLFTIMLYIMAGLLRSLPLLVSATIFNGFAHPLLIVGAEAYVRKHNGNGSASPFGLYVALDYFGWILGMLLGALLIPHLTVNTIFFLVLPGILTSFFIFPHIRERGIRSLFKAIKRLFHSLKDFIIPIRDFADMDHRSWYFFVISFLDGVVRMFTLVFVPLFGLSIGMSYPMIGVMMAVMYSPFVLSYFLSQIVDQYSRMNMLAVSLILGACAFSAFYFVIGHLFVILLLATMSFSMAIIRPACNGAITRLTPRRMLGEVTGMYNFVDRLGRIFGPLLTGWIADLYGIEFSFLLIAGISVLLGIFAILHHGYDTLVLRESV